MGSGAGICRRRSWERKFQETVFGEGKSSADEQV